MGHVDHEEGTRPACLMMTSPNRIKPLRGRTKQRTAAKQLRDRRGRSQTRLRNNTGRPRSGETAPLDANQCNPPNPEISTDDRDECFLLYRPVCLRGAGFAVCSCATQSRVQLLKLRSAPEDQLFAVAEGVAANSVGERWGLLWVPVHSADRPRLRRLDFAGPGEQSGPPTLHLPKLCTSANCRRACRCAGTRCPGAVTATRSSSQTSRVH